MRPITTDERAVLDHLMGQFGAVSRCPAAVRSLNNPNHYLGCGYVAPPPGVPFEVLEPLEVEPSPQEESRYERDGLTKVGGRFWVPVGTYRGLDAGGVFHGTTIHYFRIIGDEAHGTRNVNVRTINGCVDWRGVRALPR